MSHDDASTAADHGSELLRRLASGIETLGGTAILVGQVARQGLRRPLGLPAIVRQVEAIGVRSTSVVLLTAVFSSMVITLQFSAQLSRFGAKEWAGNAVGVTLARELGPVMTALMVGGRVGAGIAAELGSMAVTEQIDAVRALGADPIKKLVVPRVLATLMVLPLMSSMAVVLGVLSGGVIASLEPEVSFNYFVQAALRSTTLSDYFSGVLKTLFFALNISAVACYRGMNTRGGTVGVGRATTETVVITSVVTLVSDFFLTKLFLAFGWGGG
ncbi:MAG: ABC transporter permease [Myxococcales bacterium]|nr:ABC transporter permease [Myxococcales bacterium]